MAENGRTPPPEEHADERTAWEGPAQPPPQQQAASRSSASDDEAWARETLAKLAFAGLNEQRRARRWGIFFKLLVLGYVALVIIAYQLEGPSTPGLGMGPYTAVVEVEGVIADNAEANADNIAAGLRAAFESEGTQGIILRANSPGGSPVQAGYISDQIQLLREQHPNTPLYVVVGDVCASGCYYMAAAADKIYANKASIVGSIGVRMSGLSTFGFVDAMDKLGIERRLFTAGDSKAMLDPFSPLQQQEVEHVKQVLNDIHEQFISVIKAGRGDRLDTDADLFSGKYWTGEQGQQLGLVDGLGSPGYVAREVIGAERTVDFTKRPQPWQRLVDRFGSAVAQGIGNIVGLHPDRLR